MTEMQLKKKTLDEQVRSNKEGERIKREGIQEQRDERKRKQSRDKWERNQGFAKTVGGLVKDASSAAGSFAGLNDPKWYSRIKGLVENVGKLPFNVADGLPLPGLIGPEYIGVDNNTTKESIPGIIRFIYAPVYGPMDGSTISPVNKAALKAYTYMRSKNASISSFQPNDLMQYFIAMDSISVLLNKLYRVYRLAYSYNKWNRMLPYYILQGMGYNVASIVNSLADFRYRINSAINAVRQFAMPAGFDIFERHKWLTSFIFKDSDTEQAQLYMFDPVMCYEYDWTNQRLNARNLYSVINTSGNVGSVFNELNLLDSMINALWHYSDIGDISNNVLKAYGESGLIQWDILDEADDSGNQVFVYSAEVLRQIHNADINLLSFEVANGSFPADSASNPWNIIQTGDYLAYSPRLSQQDPALAAHVTSNSYNLPTMLNEKIVLDAFGLKDPTCDDVMVMSRLKHIELVTASGNTVTCSYGYFGSEIITGTRVINIVETAGANVVASNVISRLYRLGASIVDYSQLGNIKSYSRTLTWFHRFDWAPQVVVFSLDDGSIQSGDKVLLLIDMFDVDNITPISQTNLIRLNDTALLSLWHNPTDEY